MVMLKFRNPERDKNDIIHNKKMMNVVFYLRKAALSAGLEEDDLLDNVFTNGSVCDMIVSGVLYGQSVQNKETGEIL